ncbi:MAG: nucleotidyltransferase domain-containing protein [Planctomycetes bacterium]|nr:nucleotidyltransferase domain-containing protein [Planctomycetota bacterium]
MPGLAGLVRSVGHRPLFVTVSGAHLYGFPSADSDVDLRGAHLLPLEDVIGLRPRRETVERGLVHAGAEVELVSHDLGKYLNLLLRNNGYVLEQIFSPIVVLGEEFLARLRPLARRCITRNLYHHYRGFLGTQLKLLEKEEPKRSKTLLYAYRVLCTGIHVLRTGEIEASLPRLNERFRLESIDELIARKRAREKEGAGEVDWARHRAKLAELEAEMGRAFEECTLEGPHPREELDELLVRERLGAGGTHR